MTDSAVPIIYQLKISLVGISPMIWRRLRINGDSSIVDLHYIIQIAMGWSDYHLNRFTIHGKDYGLWHPGGISFSDDPDSVRLADFQLREREKFSYEYDFTDRWVHQLRVEEIHYSAAPLTAPICIAGKRSAPPEDCGGALAYLSKRQHYSYGHGIGILADIQDRGPEAVSENIDEMQHLIQWLSLEKFDRAAVNHRLERYAAGDRQELFAEVIG